MAIPPNNVRLFPTLSVSGVCTSLSLLNPYISQLRKSKGVFRHFQILVDGPQSLMVWSYDPEPRCSLSGENTNEPDVLECPLRVAWHGVDGSRAWQLSHTTQRQGTVCNNETSVLSRCSLAIQLSAQLGVNSHMTWHQSHYSSLNLDQSICLITAEHRGYVSLQLSRTSRFCLITAQLHSLRIAYFSPLS